MLLEICMTSVDTKGEMLKNVKDALFRRMKVNGDPGYQGQLKVDQIGN